MSLLRRKASAAPQPGSFDELLSTPPPAKKTIFKFALKDKSKSKGTNEEETEEEDSETKGTKWQSPFRFSSGKAKPSKTEEPLATPKLFGRLDHKHKEDLQTLEAQTNALHSEINNTKSALDQEMIKNQEQVAQEKERLKELDAFKEEAAKEAKGPEPEVAAVENENDVPDESDELYQEAKAEGAEPQITAATDFEDKELHSVQVANFEESKPETLEPPPSHVETTTATAETTEAIITPENDQIGSVKFLKAIENEAGIDDITEGTDHIGGAKGLRTIEKSLVSDGLAADGEDHIGDVSALEGAEIGAGKPLDEAKVKAAIGAASGEEADEGAVKDGEVKAIVKKESTPVLKASNSKKVEATNKTTTVTGKFGGIKKFFGSIGVQQSSASTPEEKAKLVAEKHSAKLSEIKTKNESIMKTIESKYDAEIAEIKEKIQRAENRILKNEEEVTAGLDKAQADHETEKKELDLKHEENKKTFMDETKQHIEEKHAEIKKSQERQAELAKELEDLESKHAEQLAINKETEDKLSTLKSQLDSQKSQVATLEQEKLKISEKIKALGAEKEEKLSIIKKSEEDLTKHTESLKDTSHVSELNTIEEEIKQLEAKLAKKDSENSKLQSTIHSTTKNISIIQTQTKENLDKLNDISQTKEYKHAIQDKQDLSLKGLNSELKELEKDKEFADKEKLLEEKIKAVQKEREELTETLKDHEKTV
ncbi:hypothetical protein WICPIJ_006110 [Wickerhamomyces pijperi]|uniref:Uncharacterized protein n=1 Tax=Wickerhamomyces pijperi TaxID=599730 RepID=A0A9P8TLA4_WICPI|nr:hypothetical protein WICPIJ_006110 [Wickerhamomyces pijperi]